MSVRKKLEFKYGTNDFSSLPRNLGEGLYIWVYRKSLKMFKTNKNYIVNLCSKQYAVYVLFHGKIFGAKIQIR